MTQTLGKLHNLIYQIDKKEFVYFKNYNIYKKFQKEFIYIIKIQFIYLQKGVFTYLQQKINLIFIHIPIYFQHDFFLFLLKE